jgi:hypothetical protein
MYVSIELYTPISSCLGDDESMVCWVSQYSLKLVLNNNHATAHTSPFVYGGDLDAMWLEPAAPREPRFTTTKPIRGLKSAKIQGM